MIEIQRLIQVHYPIGMKWQNFHLISTELETFTLRISHCLEWKIVVFLKTVWNFGEKSQHIFQLIT